MQHIEPHQRNCAELLAAAKEVGDSVTDERNALSNFQPDGSAPVGFLVPRQSVTCQAEANDAQKEQNSTHPNHLPRLFVCAPQKDANEVNDEQKHDYPSRPVVERSDELAEGQVVLNVLDGRVGLVGGRAVVEHHCPARDEQNHQTQKQQGAEDMSPTDGGGQRLRLKSVPSADQACLSFKPIQKATQHSATPFVDFQLKQSVRNECSAQTDL